MPDAEQSIAEAPEVEPPVEQEKPSIGDRAIGKLSRQIAGLTRQLAITEAINEEQAELIAELKGQLVETTAATATQTRRAAGAAAG